MLRRNRAALNEEPSAVTTPAPEPPAVEEADRPEPPDGARNLVVVVLDSLRYDSFCEANTPVLSAVAEVERRWSYASWTAPSHYNLLMGLLPHTSPSGVYASEYYKEDFVRYTHRLGVPDMEFKRLLPSLYLPTYLQQTLGYRTHAMVSMPVLNRHTLLNHHFDTYELMPRHNDMAAMLDQLQFGDRPTFQLLNVGETHYPYALPDEDPSEWPRISGVHGVFKHLDDHVVGGALSDDEAPNEFFDEATMEDLRRRQVRAAAYVDGLFERLLDIVPANTWLIVTADHGELFGEEGYFGHGPIAHDKVFEVPFLEAKIR